MEMRAVGIWSGVFQSIAKSTHPFAAATLLFALATHAKIEATQTVYTP
jgi:hypothetical protein